MSEVAMKRTGYDWGDIFLRHRRKGMDPSDAAFRADEWENRQKRKVEPPSGVPRPKNPPRPKTPGQVG